MKKSARQRKSLKAIQEQIGNLVESLDRAKHLKSGKSIKGALEEIIRDCEWAGLDPLEVRRFIDASVSKNDVATVRYIRKVLPEKFKLMSKAREVRGRDKIKELQNKNRSLREQNRDSHLSPKG